MANTIENYSTPEIRQKAEEIVRNKHEDPDESISDADKLQLYHELEVHQMELELQNEELMHSREEAWEAAQKYALLYEAAPTSFFTLGSKGHILEMNTFASQLLGKRKDELINSYFTSFVHKEDQYIFDSFLENVFNNQAQSTCEVRLQPMYSQNPVYVVLTGILVIHWGKCMVTALDITEQKKALHSVIESQRLGAIGEMANSIAHDFNNALQSLLGNLELALNEKENTRHLKIMKTLLNDAAGRVKLLQRFSGKDSGQEPYCYININSLVEDVIAQTRPLWKDQAEAKGISILIEYKAEEEFGVRGNEGELRTVLFNVIKNSIEAMPLGGLIIIEPRQGNGHVILTITDTGIGMDEETKLRVFQPFYSTKDLNPGRGMGMSSVLNIIKEHQGDVYIIHTAPGKGTTIEIKLPVFKAEKRFEKTGHQDEENVKCQVGTLKLLWVDDDDDIRMFAEEAIKMMGHNVTMAQSGKEALQFLENNTYDLVITDIGMPEMNGWQLADKIKEKPGNVNIAVISGWGAQINEKELTKHGVNFMHDKPFKLSQLKELLESLA